MLMLIKSVLFGKENNCNYYYYILFNERGKYFHYFVYNNRSDEGTLESNKITAGGQLHMVLSLRGGCKC